MPATFEARLDILPESQRRLWPELDAVPSEFVLYGGTALALQLGHRVSEDFARSFDPSISIRALQFYGDGTLDRVPGGMQRDLTRWAQTVDLDKLPALHAKQGLSLPGGLER
jgi:hypothetical protein